MRGHTRKKLKVNEMKRGILLASIAISGVAAFAGSVLAAPPVVASPSASVAGKPAACIQDVRAFSEQMQKGGYWLGASGDSYGYPMGGYGYGLSYPMVGYPAGSGIAYENLRPGYEVRTLMASADILAQNGQQVACQTVLTSAQDIYKRYAAQITGRGLSRDKGPDWQQQQIAGAQPVTDQTAIFRSAQLIDTAVLNAQDVSLGSVHDIVISPTTGKIAYLIIGRGGIFGFDQTYVPVPWNDFKVSENMNLLVLSTTKAAMNAAPAMSDAQFTGHGDFVQQSKRVDNYWQSALLVTSAK